MSIGHSPHVPQHAPDMRKKDEEITQSELEDAKRRIGGSLSSDVPSGQAPSAAAQAG